MAKLICSYFWSHCRSCGRHNRVCKLNLISIVHFRQVVMAFEVSFEDGKRVFDGIVIGRVWWEKFKLYAIVCDDGFKFL
jgi:hypothetical protein